MLDLSEIGLPASLQG